MVVMVMMMMIMMVLQTSLCRWCFFKIWSLPLMNSYVAFNFKFASIPQPNKVINSSFIKIIVALIHAFVHATLLCFKIKSFIPEMHDSSSTTTHHPPLLCPTPINATMISSHLIPFLFIHLCIHSLIVIYLFIIMIVIVIYDNCAQTWHRRTLKNWDIDSRKVFVHLMMMMMMMMMMLWICKPLACSLNFLRWMFCFE